MDLSALNPFRRRQSATAPTAPVPLANGDRLKEQAPAYGYSSLIGTLSPVSLAGEMPPGAQGYVTYRRMQHDPQVKACLSTKKFAVLSRGWEVHPADDTPAAAAVAGFVRDCLNGMDGSVLDALYAVMDALALGVSIVEINYRWIESGPHKGKLGLKSLKSKDPSIFNFDVDSFLNLIGLRIAGGELLAPAKFLIYSYQPLYENPLGTSDLRAAYRMWVIKEQLLGWWAKYLEKFGIPTVLGQYSEKSGYSQAQKQSFLRSLMQVHNETALALPDDMTVSLLEATRSTEAGFEEAIAYCDRGIAKSILGETLTADSSAKGSSYALGQVHMDVLSFYLQKLQRDLEETVMTRQLVARLVAQNYAPGSVEAGLCPAFRLGKIDDGKLQTAANLISQLVTGEVVQPGEPWIREYLGIPAATAQTM